MAGTVMNQAEVNDGLHHLIKKRINDSNADCLDNPNDYRCLCPHCDPPGSCGCPPCDCNINPGTCYDCPCTRCLSIIVPFCPPLFDSTVCCDACGGYVGGGTCPK